MTILKKEVQKFYMPVAEARDADESHGDLAYFHDATPPGWFLCQDHNNTNIPTANNDIIIGRKNDIIWHRQSIVADNIGNGGIVPKEYIAGEVMLAQEITTLGGVLYVSNVSHTVTADNVTNQDQLTPISTEAKIIPEEYVAGLSVSKDELVMAAGALYTADSAHTATADNVTNTDLITPVSTPAASTDPVARNYALGETFAAHELVRFGGFIRRSTIAHTVTNDNLINEDRLAAIVSIPSPAIKAYAVGAQFISRELGLLGNDLVVSTTTHAVTADNVTNEDRITRVHTDTASPTIAGDFVGTANYVANELIVEAGRLYRRNDGGGTALASFALDAANWTEISEEGSILVPDFAAGTEYTENELVIEAGRLYRRINTATSLGSWALDQANWSEVSPAVPQVLNDWAANTEYADLSFVAESGRLYRRNVGTAGNSGANFAADSGNWTEISEPQDITLANWTINTDYAAHELVIESDRLYRRKAANAGNSGADFATDLTNWDEISVQAKVIVSNWTRDTDYATNELMTDFNNRLYRRILAGTSRGTYDPTERALWEEVSTNAIRNFADGVQYAAHEMIVEAGRLYRRNGAGISGADFATDAANWTEISAPQDIVIGDWAGDMTYADHEMVIHEGRLLRRNGAGDSESTFDVTEAAAWDVIHADRSRIRELAAGMNVGLNEVVFLADTTYRASVAVTNVDLSDLSSFQVIATRQQIRGQYATGTTYRQNEMMFLGSELYIALRDFTSDSPVNDMANSDLRQLNPAQHIGYRGEYTATTEYLTEDLFFSGDILYRVVGDYTAVNIGDDLTNGDIVIVSSDAVIVTGDYQAGGTTYTAGQLLFQSNRIYHVQQLFVSVDWVTDNVPANLVELSPPANPSAPDWTADTTYAKDSLVINGDTIYRRNADGDSGAVFDPLEWTALKAQASAIVANFLDTVTYAQFELVFNAGILYRANATVNAGLAFDESEWTRVAENKTIIQEFKANTDYAQREAIQHNGKIYLADVAFTSTASIVLSDWVEAIIPRTIINDWVADTAYEANEVTRVGDILYRRKTAGTSESVWLDDLVNQDAVSPQNTDVVIPSWETGVTYAIGESVVEGGSLYRRNAPGLSRGTFDATEEAEWDNLSDRTYLLNQWVADTEYQGGELIVGANDELYRRNATSVSAATWVLDEANWTEVSASADMIVLDWATNTDYADHELIIRVNRLYRRKAATAGNSGADWATDETNWDEISEQARILVPDFIGDTAYETNELMIESGRLYRRNLAGDSGAAFDATEQLEWTEVSPEADMVVLDWAADTVYEANELTVNGDKLYRRKLKGTSAADWATDETNWDEISASVDILIQAWAADTAYKKDNMVTLGSRLFQRRADGDSGSTFDDAEELLWLEIAPSEAVSILEWDAAETYEEDVQVRYRNRVYTRNNAARSANDVFSLTHFARNDTEIVENLEFNDAEIYLEGDYFQVLGVTFRAMAAKDVGVDWATFEVNSFRVDPLTFLEFELSTRYYRGDVFKLTHRTFIASETFVTTGTGNAEDIDPLDHSQLIEISNETRTRAAAYTDGDSIDEGELVTHDDALWIALSDVDGTDGSQDTWTEIESGMVKVTQLVNPVAVAFNAADTYTNGDLVLFDGYTFTRNGNARSANDPFSLTHFDRNDAGGLERGAFVDAEHLVDGDFFKVSGIKYRAAADKEPGVDWATFAVLAVRVDTVSFATLATDTSYIKGDFFRLDEHGYVAIDSFTTTNNGDSTDTDPELYGDLFLLADDARSIVASYTDGDSIKSGELVRNAGSLWMATVDIDGTNAATDTWVEIESSMTEIVQLNAPVVTVFDASATYSEGDLVSFQNFVFTRNNTARSANDPFSLTQFDRNIGGGIDRGVFADAEHLVSGDTFTVSDVRYRANADKEPGVDWATFTANASRIEAINLTAIVADTTYVKGDRFRITDQTFVATIGFTSTNHGNATDTNPELYTELFLISDDARSISADYTDGDTLVKNEMVRHDNKLWIAPSAIDGTDAGSDTWAEIEDTMIQVLDLDIASAAPFVAADTYSEGDPVTFQNFTWLRNSEARNPGDAFRVAHWDRTVPGGVHHGEWNASLYYLVGDTVTRNGYTYRVNTDLNSAIWHIFENNSTRLEPMYLTSMTANGFHYVAGDVFHIDDKSYIATTSFVSTSNGDSTDTDPENYGQLMLLSDESKVHAGDYTDGDSLRQGEIVRHFGVLMVATEVIDGTTGSSDTWAKISDRMEEVMVGSQVNFSTVLADQDIIVFDVKSKRGDSWIASELYVGGYLGFVLDEGDKLELKHDRTDTDVPEAADFYLYKAAGNEEALVAYDSADAFKAGDRRLLQGFVITAIGSIAGGSGYRETQWTRENGKMHAFGEWEVGAPYHRGDTFIVDGYTLEVTTNTAAPADKAAAIARSAKVLTSPVRQLEADATPVANQYAIKGQRYEIIEDYTVELFGHTPVAGDYFIVKATTEATLVEADVTWIKRETTSTVSTATGTFKFGTAPGTVIDGDAIFDLAATDPIVTWTDPVDPEVTTLISVTINGFDRTADFELDTTTAMSLTAVSTLSVYGGDIIVIAYS